MRQKLEIYNYDRRIETILGRIKDSSIDQKSKDQILEFYMDSLARGLSKARAFKYLYTVENLAKFLGIPFGEATKEDIAELVRKIEGKSYADWTKHDYKVIIKVFYRFLRQTDEYPNEVKWIRATIKHNKMLPEELLTEDDVKKLAERATTLRDKAFILVLYESGCRVGEVLSLRVRNVQFDNYGAVLIVSGKTGDRRVRIIASAPKLSSWLDNHPLREDIDSPLWVTLGTRARNKPFSYKAAKAMLKDTARRAEIKKRIYPHLFRHSRATFLAKHLTESQLKQHFGWVQASEMASTYVHLSGRDVDNSLLKLQGIKVDSQVDEAVLKTVSCQRCNENNSPDSKFCMRCGSPLDVETALKLDETRAKADKLMSILVQDPEILERLLKQLESMK
ncbi:MAG: site-specific integrase [Candidatus Aenigmatarchaeota archaeon]